MYTFNRREAKTFILVYNRPCTVQREPTTARLAPSTTCFGRFLVAGRIRLLGMTPGVRVRLTREFAVQGRVFLPVIEGWHGLRARNVGQVAPDVTFQLSVAYRFNLNQF